MNKKNERGYKMTNIEDKRDNFALVFSIIALLVSIGVCMYLVNQPTQDISEIDKNSESISYLNDNFEVLYNEIDNIQVDIKSINSTKIDLKLYERIIDSEEDIEKLQKFKRYIRNCADDNEDFDSFRDCVNDY